MNKSIEIILGDITKMNTDAIVNAANRSLLGGGGVDGAIHMAAGKELVRECMTLGGCMTGEAKITSAYKLPCKYVIHTVGPVYDENVKGQDKLLENCYVNSLKLAEENNLETVSFSAISTGAYGYPIDEACQIAFSAVAKTLPQLKRVRKVFFVCFNQKVLDAFKKAEKNFKNC